MRQIGGMIIGMLAVLVPAGCGSSTGLNLASVRGTKRSRRVPSTRL